MNTLKFIRLRESGAPKDQLQTIARDELDNARAAKQIYASAPWLNHNMRLDVGAPDSVKMVDEKIRLLEQFLK